MQFVVAKAGRLIHHIYCNLCPKSCLKLLSKELLDESGIGPLNVRKFCAMVSTKVRYSLAGLFESCKGITIKSVLLDSAIEVLDLVDKAQQAAVILGSS
jgi:hypothetical protein